MPVIVVGADTPIGMGIVEALIEPGREVRAFVSDPDAAARLKGRGVKVAIGDVSDDSHVEGASLHCFTMVLVTDAARDDRERSFAGTEDEVLAAWGRAASAAGVTRVIWVHAGEPPPTAAPESAVVDPARPGLAREVARLDDARVLP